MATVDGAFVSRPRFVWGTAVNVLPAPPAVSNAVGALMPRSRFVWGTAVSVLPAAPAVSNAVGALMPRPRFRLGVSVQPIHPSEFPPVIRVSGVSRYLRALPMQPGDTGILIGLNTRREVYPALGATVFPTSSGRVSHLRALAAYRTGREAEESHEAMRSLES